MPQTRAVRTFTAALLGATFLSPAGGAFAQDAVVLETLNVEAASNDILVQDGYVAQSGRIGSKTDTPLVEVPQAISTVTEKQLDDQNPRTLNEALGYVPGARVGSYGFDPRFDAFFIRGFPLTYNGIFRDGLRQFASPTGLFKTEIYGLEGITVLKGPASALYGATSAGGLVDLMTKRPTEYPFRELEVQYGSHDRKQGNFDLSGPLTDDGTLLYRLTGVVRDSGTEIDGFPDDRFYIAPAFTWQPNEDTKLTVLGEYMDATTGGTAAYHNLGGRITGIYEGDPRYNDFNQKQGRIGYEFEHRVSDWLLVRQNARYLTLHNDLEYAYITDITTTPFTRAAGRNAEQVDSFVIDNQVQAEFSTGAVDHTVLVGVDYGWIGYDQRQGFGALPAAGTLPLAFSSAQDMTQFGLYAQDQARFGNWRLTVGGRYDWLTGDTTLPDATGGRVTTTQEDQAFSWRVGLGYVTEFGLVPYASYTTSFTPNVGTVVSGGPAKPTIGKQVEGGAKYALPGTNAVLTASVFQIEQEDGVVFDASTGVNRQVQLDMRSRGFELEANASLENGLSLIASYAYVETEILRGAAGTVGNELTSTPNHQFSVWADYTLQSGPAEGLGFGAGVRYVGRSFGDDLNTIENADRVYLDAALHYDFAALNPRMKGVRAQVNATNLLDHRGVTCTSGYCYRDEGRSVIGSLRYRF